MSIFSNKPSKEDLYKMNEQIIATGYVEDVSYLMTFLWNELNNSDSVNYNLFLSKLDMDWYKSVFQKAMYRYFKLGAIYLQDENSWNSERNKIDRCYEEMYQVQEKIKYNIKTMFYSLGNDAVEQIESAFLKTLNETKKCGINFSNNSLFF